MLDNLETTEPPAVDDCDCAPSERERRALWPSVFSRRSALAVGAIGLAAVGIAAAPRVPAAVADGYPSWADVQAAKANQAAAQSEVGRIQTLIQNLQAQVTATQADATQKTNAYYDAQQAYYDAARRADSLQTQADAQASKAKQAAQKAGAVAAQLYRNGGDNATLQLFLSGSAASADDLLAKLGTMDTLLKANRSVYTDAVTARDAAQSLSDQAKAARDERDKLQQAAQKAMQDAQAAADAAQKALSDQNTHLDDLQSQLAALKDTTAKTVADYQAGVAYRKQLADEAAARARAAAAAAAASHGNGGTVQSSGWCRPSSGWQSSGYGARAVQCTATYCASSFHYGVDLASACGSAIYAACSGKVVYAGPNGGYGNYIHIDHGDGTGSGYGHIRDGGIAVRVGQYVSVGDYIAAEGNTGFSFGCHLHFETYINNVPVNPVPFMADRGISV